MKNQLFSLTLLALICSVSVFLSSCKKEAEVTSVYFYVISDHEGEGYFDVLEWMDSHPIYLINNKMYTSKAKSEDAAEKANDVKAKGAFDVLVESLNLVNWADETHGRKVKFTYCVYRGPDSNKTIVGEKTFEVK